MQINKDIKVEAIDSRNICILKKTIVKDEEKQKILGYYSTPQNALKALINKEIIGTGLKDFETVCNKIDELKKIIDGFNIKLETPNKNKDDDMTDFLGE